MMFQIKNYTKRYVRFMCVLGCAIVLVACAETATEKNVTTLSDKQIATTVKIFPDGYFVTGYVENYIITGVDDKGTNYTGLFQVATGIEEVFNGINAIPVVITLSYTTIINGVQVSPITIVLTEYFTIAQPRQYLGSVNSNTSLFLTSQGPAIEIADVVIVDTSDVMAILLGSDSSVEVIELSLQDNINDTYEVSFTSNHTDSAGGLINHEVRSFTIDETSERLAWSLIAEIPSLNNVLRFSGARI